MLQLMNLCWYNHTLFLFPLFLLNVLFSAPESHSIYYYHIIDFSCLFRLFLAVALKKLPSLFPLLFSWSSQFWKVLVRCFVKKKKSFNWDLNDVLLIIRMRSYTFWSKTEEVKSHSHHTISSVYINSMTYLCAR